MDRAGLRQTLNEDGSELTITFELNDLPLGYISLTPAEVETLIHQLAGHRERMNESVARDIEPNARLAAIVDPIWRSTHAQGLQGLCLRHPGLGWLAFVFPKNEAEAIARHLLQKGIQNS